MAEMDDVKNLEIAQINDANLRREREKLQAENPTREGIAPVDVKTDPGRTYFADAPEQPAPQQAPAAPQQSAEDFSAPVADGAPRIVSNGKDYTSRQIISAPVQGTNQARTTLFFGNESAMPQAFAQATKQYNAPQSAEDRTSADYIASLNRTYSERRRQNGLRNDLIVTNAAEVKLTGNKEELKEYQRYSGWRDGLKRFSAAEMRAKHPDRMIKEAVWGMLPKNNIARKMMTRLKVFAGAEHTHAAQKPVEIKL